MCLSEWSSFLLFKKQSLKAWRFEDFRLYSCFCLGFLFCCMTQLLLCCWYVALFSRSVKLCNAFFFIFTTKTIKVIFWKKLVVTSSFFTQNLASKWGNGKWKSSWTLPSLLQLWKVLWAHFAIISGVEVTPLGSVCLAFLLQGLHLLKMTPCFRSSERLDVPWAHLDWKNRLCWTFSECMSGLSFLRRWPPGCICSVLGFPCLTKALARLAKNENYPL